MKHEEVSYFELVMEMVDMLEKKEMKCIEHFFHYINGDDHQDLFHVIKIFNFI